MKHPNREELSEFLYDELAPEQRAEVSAHLAACAECRTQVESWRGVRQELGSWKLPQAHPRVVKPVPVPLLWPLLRWAAAAMLMAGAGFGIARVSAPTTPNTAQLRAELARELRGELKQELQTEFTKFAADQSARQQDHQQAIARLIGRLEATRLADLADLRKDVETVAVRAQDEFLATRQDLYQLAADGPANTVQPNN